jgi:hypothetical protein
MSADIQKARDLFIAAVSRVAPEHWDTYLDETCAGDEVLRARVQLLLRAHAEAGTFLDQPATPHLAAFAEVICPEAAGMVLGRYRLVEPLGEGGMGTVWLAEQTQPVRRQVAVKVIRPGMECRQVFARLEAECQALARMDHPNIAKVLDAGTIGEPGAGGGRPYLVMELVKGAGTIPCASGRPPPNRKPGSGRRYRPGSDPRRAGGAASARRASPSEPEA